MYNDDYPDWDHVYCITAQDIDLCHDYNLTEQEKDILYRKVQEMDFSYISDYINTLASQVVTERED